MPSELSWLGSAPGVAQVDTYTPAGVAVGNVFNLTAASGAVLSYVAAVNTAADVVTGLLSALNGAGPEFQLANWQPAAGGGALIATSNLAGRPFAIASSAVPGTGGGAPTFAHVATTPNSGPNNWGNPLNWALTAGGAGTVPVTGDTVHLDGAVSIKYDLPQAGVTLALLDAPASFTGEVGLPRWNPAGYAETLPRFLHIKATVVNVGKGEGLGSPRFYLDTDNAPVTGSLLKTASSSETGLPAFLWKGTAAANAWRITRGTFGAAWQAGEVATIADLKVGWATSQLTDAQVTIGAGTTLGTIEKTGGVLTTYCAFTSIKQTLGTARHAGSLAGATIALVQADGGMVYLDADNVTITNVEGSGSFSLDGSLLPITIGNLNLYEGFEYTDTNLRATYTVGPKFHHCGDLSKLHVGENFQINGFTIL
jgi:hypothetical protein